VHPEVSFSVLKGDVLREGKKTWNGLWERLELLASAGIQLPTSLLAGGAPADDVVDSAAAAWSAHRKALGLARTLPKAPPLLRGRPVAIWY
jgi:predicted RNase H-like nuclease